MKIIVPMAGAGKRMRPHTLTTPKPLLPVAGKPIVQRLIEDIAKVCSEPIEEIAYIIGDFGKEVEKNLKKIASDIGAESAIYYQDQPLGTAHAILCAKKSLKGKVVVAFADTLFKADFKLDATKDGIIWVKKIEDPRAFGVVKVNHANIITDFVEKPQVFVSDLAIIGIYFFNDGEYLCRELEYLIEKNIKDKGEYQLTSALENMKSKGSQFVPGNVSEWLDCGNKDAMVYTNKRILELSPENNLVSSSLKKESSIIIPPCYIGENVKIINSVVGPHVSIGNNSVIINSVISESIVQTNSTIKFSNIKNSMVGNFVEYTEKPRELSLGDYSVTL